MKQKIFSHTFGQKRVTSQDLATKERPTCRKTLTKAGKAPIACSTVLMNNNGRGICSTYNKRTEENKTKGYRIKFRDKKERESRRFPITYQLIQNLGNYLLREHLPLFKASITCISYLFMDGKYRLHHIKMGIQTEEDEKEKKWKHKKVSCLKNEKMVARKMPSSKGFHLYQDLCCGWQLTLLPELAQD